MKYIQNITLDVNCNPANYQYINAKQCDNASRVLKVTLTSNNQQIKPETGTEAIFRCLKPDGNSCVNPAVINADGTVTVEFTKQELAIKGVTLADISLIKNETILSTVSFRIMVDEAPISVSKVKSSGEFLILLDTIKAAETAIEKSAVSANEAQNAAEAADEAANLANAAKIEAEEAAQNANVAVDNANSAAQAAKALVDDVNIKLVNGEFDGSDYVLTAADKTEIAKLVEPLAESMQGGTVTYEIPKEYYSADFFAFDRNNQSNPSSDEFFIPSAMIDLAEIKFDAKKFDEDADAGLIDSQIPEDIDDWSINEQLKFYDNLYESYTIITQYPWTPEPIRSWLYFPLKNSQFLPMQLVFRNNMDVQFIIRRKNSIEEATIIANPNLIYSDGVMNDINIFYPQLFIEYIEDGDFQIYKLKLYLIGDSPKYASDKRYATAVDTIEETTITFIPNNTFVEADKNESI